MARRVAVAVACLVSAAGARAAQAQSADVVAELPRIYLNTAALPAPAPGRLVIKVGAGGNLQAALNKAQPGDVIELAQGTTFTGNFILPYKKATSAAWIVIRPENYASLPSEGVRMTPAIAATLALPQILTPNSSHAIGTDAAAHHYRLVGLDVSVTPGLKESYGLIGLDGGEHQTEAGIPHDIVLDRLYVHGTPDVALRRCLTFNSASSAVIDSWVSDCHDRGSDSQAIAGWNGPGPFKIVNNYLEGAGENIIFGGADPTVQNLTPSDLEIRRNHITKPLSWKRVWLVKNLFELKHAQRVLLEGNILENSWSHGQNGLGIGIKSVNQNGNCRWCMTQDVTVRFNLIRNVGAAVNIAGSPDTPFPTGQTRRISIVDNLILNVNAGQFDGDGRGFAIFGAPFAVLIAHNTMLAPTNSAFVFGPAGSRAMNFSAHDNVVGGGQYGLLGDNAQGTQAFNTYAPNGVFRGNVMVIAGAPGDYPAGNFYPSSYSQLRVVDRFTENFRLSPSSPYRRAGTDGRVPGANIDSLDVMIRGVRVQP